MGPLWPERINVSPEPPKLPPGSDLELWKVWLPVFEELWASWLKAIAKKQVEIDAIYWGVDYVYQMSLLTTEDVQNFQQINIQARLFLCVHLSWHICELTQASFIVCIFS